MKLLCKKHNQSFFFTVLFILFVLGYPQKGQTSQIVVVAGGERHSVALQDGGTVWAWGENSGGQLGDGSGELQYSAVRVLDPEDPTGLLTGVDAVAAGTGYWFDLGGHTIALKNDGTVVTWGYNWNGQLGDGTKVTRSTAVYVTDPSDSTGFLTGAVAVGAGDEHSLAAKSDGTVWAWGYNNYGQLGNGTTDNSSIAVKVSGLSNVTALEAGAGFSLALQDDGTVWGWGQNSSGQLGDGTTFNQYTPVQVTGLQNITAIAAGDEHSLALKSDGSVWAWGANPFGQLGTGTAGWGTSMSIPVQVTDPSDPAGYLSGVTAIAGGDDFSIALKSDGSVWTWGANNWNQLGDGTVENRHTPIQVSGLTNIIAIGAGNGHCLAAKSDGTVWAWGGNWSGQLGDGTTDQRSSPVQVTFSEQEEGLLDVRGPFFLTPGEQVTFVIYYHNILDEPLEETVVLIDLPGDFSFVTCTEDGIYRGDYHQVFWKLGLVSPGEGGYLSLKMEVPWGLPPHTPRTMLADILARNLDSSVDLDEYLEYMPVEVASEKDLATAEVAAMLGSHPELKAMLDTALQQDHVFGNVAQQIDFSNGDTVTILTLIDADGYGPIFLYENQGSVFMEQYDVGNYEMSDNDGGFRFSIDDGSFQSWGSWALSSSPQKSVCIHNCIMFSDKTWLNYIRDEWKGRRRYPCIHCQTLLKRTDAEAKKLAAEQCAECAGLYFKDHRRKIRLGRKGNIWGNVVRKCLYDCAVDSTSYECGENRLSCGPSQDKLDHAFYGIGVQAVLIERCVAVDLGGSKYTKKETQEACPNGKCVWEPSPHCVFPCKGTKRVLKKLSVEEQICERNMTAVDAEVIVAHDPNAKHVDAGGDILPGQELSYTIEYENEGEATAYDVFVLDELCSELDEATLVIEDGGEFSEDTRQLVWEIGEVPSGGQGEVSFSIKAREDLSGGTEVVNFADVHFPSVPEITPTNPVVNVIASIAAIPQSIETTAGASVAITLSGRDTGRGTLVYEITERPGYGTLTGTPPSVTYTSMEEFSGQDEFYFNVSSGQEISDPARVIITVNPSTSDSTPPEVSETYPEAGAGSVHIAETSGNGDTTAYSPTVTAIFSESMDADTLTADSFIVDGVTASVYYDEEMQKAYYVPTSPLSHSTTYTARLTTAVKDKAGNALASEYSWQFTTESPANISVVLPDNTDELYFGIQLLSTSSEEEVISLVSTGTTGLQIASVSVSGTDAADFQINSDTCSGQILEQSQNCTVAVSFASGTTGAKTASLAVSSNDPDTAVLEVPLSGKCVESYTQYSLRARARPFFGGMVTADGVDCPGDCSEAYNEETPVVLTAVPREGFTFAGWDNDACGFSTYCAVSMTDDLRLTAQFEPECASQTIAAGDEALVNMLYALRDEILSQDKRGAEHARDYYAHVQDIQSILLTETLLLEKIKNFIQQARPHLQELVTSRHTVISEDVIQEGLALIDELILAADQRLQKSLINLRSDFQDTQWLHGLGLKVDE